MTKWKLWTSCHFVLSWNENANEIQSHNLLLLLFSNIRMTECGEIHSHSLFYLWNCLLCAAKGKRMRLSVLSVVVLIIKFPFYTFALWFYILCWPSWFKFNYNCTTFSMEECADRMSYDTPIGFIVVIVVVVYIQHKLHTIIAHFLLPTCTRKR